jgi:hypothetical protein
VCRSTRRWLRQYSDGNITHQELNTRFCPELRMLYLDRVRAVKGSAAVVSEEELARQHDREAWWEILGNPFDTVAIEPAWLLFQEGIVGQLARAIDTDNDFSRMPILGDALEEAGCTSMTILDHCRKEGTHLPGCWVVDQILSAALRVE